MRWLQLLFIATLSIGSLQGAVFEKELQSQGYTLFLKSDKPLVVGTNLFHARLTKEGKACEAKKLSIKAFMPAMPGMPAMEDKRLMKSLGEGGYKSLLNFSMGGTWQIHIIVSPKEGKKIRLKSSLDL